MKLDEVKKLVESIGLSDKEASVYLSLLSFDYLKVSDLAKKVDIHRVALYAVLDNLIQKGLANKFKKSGATYFSALSPKRLLNYMDREREDMEARYEKQRKLLEEMIPKIESTRFEQSDKPHVQFYEGKKGMREAYEDTLTAQETIRAYANVQTMHEALPNFFPKYYKRRTDAKIAIRAIMPNNTASQERAEKDPQELRQSRFLTDDNTFSPEVNIYNNKVLITSWKEQMAIIIESKEYADLQKSIYDQLWKSLPKS